MNYMKKTKKELIEVIKELLAENMEIKGALESKKNSEKISPEAMKNLQRDLKEAQVQFIKCEEEKSLLQEALNDLKKDYLELQEKENNRVRQLDMLAEDRRILKEDLEAVQSRLTSHQVHQQVNYELFKSFVDNHSERILLIDASYSIKYVNATASDFLGIQGGDLMNRRIFDFTQYDDAIRLKERIDKTFLEGEKGKVKKIHFQGQKGSGKKLKIKMQRVRFQDKPSVKMMINE